MKQGWKIITIGDACEKGSSSVSQNELTDEMGDYPIFGASGIIKKVSFYHQDRPYLSIVKDGSGYGRVTRMDPYTSVIGTLQYLLPKDDIDVDYLYYSLISVDFKKYVAGAAIPHIYFKDYKGEPFLWMPLQEQRRIVSAINQAFAAINKVIANAEQNLKNVDELFESYLESIFQNMIEGEHNETLDNLCELIVDCEHKTAPTQASGYPSIRTPNIGKGYLILDNVNRVSEKTYKEWTKRATPRSGDLILAREAPAGNVGIIPENLEACLGQRTVLIRTKKEKVIPKYLASLMLSHSVQAKLLLHSKGATVEHINMKDIRAFKIYGRPSINEQKIVVERLDALRSKTEKLEKVYKEKLNNLAELKKSILQKAFRGELKTSKAVPA